MRANKKTKVKKSAKPAKKNERKPSKKIAAKSNPVANLSFPTNQWDKKSSELVLSRLRQIESDEGYCSERSLQKLAQELDVPIIKLYGIATFFSFLTTKPRGRHVIRVCYSISCHLNKSSGLLQILERELGIKPGETTRDGRFSLRLTSCIGACDAGPALLMDGMPYTRMDEAKVKELLGQYK